MAAKYGRDGMMPTVENSKSGNLFLAVGLIAGFFVTYYLHQTYHFPAIPALLFACAAICVWVHKAIGESIKATRSTSGTSSNPRTVLHGDYLHSSHDCVSCPKCGQLLRLPGSGRVVTLRCPKCRHEFPPQGGPQAYAQKGTEQNVEDKGMFYAFVATGVSGTFFFNVCSHTYPGNFFSPPITERFWPGIIIGTFICAAIAYSVGKKS